MFLQPLTARVASVAYPTEAGGRDQRLDLLRGFAIFAMVVDHFGGRSWFTYLTGGNEFLVSAAEGFVFLSGFVTGMVYGRRINRDGWLAAAEAIIRRAALLYLVTVGLTLLFVALFLLTDLRLWFDRVYGLGLTDPVELVVGTLTLHYTYHGTDILWMYTVLMSATPLFFHFLVTGRTGFLLAISVLLWLIYQIFPAQAAIPWVAGNAINFPIAAWQLYFVVGLAMGYHRDTLARWLGCVPPGPALLLATLGLVGLILLDWGHDTGRIATWPLLSGLAGESYQGMFDKPSVAWGRVVAFAIVASFFFLFVTRFWQPVKRLLGWLLLPLGQAALLAYALHLIVVVVVYNLDQWGLYDRSRTANTLLQSVAVGIVLGLVRSWHALGALPRRLARVLEAPPRLNRGLGVATSGLLVLLTIGTAILLGPVRASRPTSASFGEASAGTLISVPDNLSDQRVVRVLLILRHEAATGPATAAPLVDQARQAGWAVIAPTLDYGDWATQDDVRAAATNLLPGLRTLVEELDDHIQQPTSERAFVYGAGRGGQLAQTFAFFYPELVRGVATVGAVPCTLPLASVGPPTDRTPLKFPFGLADVVSYRGEPTNFEALSKVSFWIQPQSARPDRPVAGCDWLGQPFDIDDHLGQFSSALAAIGNDVQIVNVGNSPLPPSQRALSFFEQLPP